MSKDKGIVVIADSSAETMDRIRELVRRSDVGTIEKQGKQPVDVPPIIEPPLNMSVVEVVKRLARLKAEFDTVAAATPNSDEQRRSKQARLAELQGAMEKLKDELPPQLIQKKIEPIKLDKQDAAALRAVSRSSRKVRRAFESERRKGKAPTEALRNIRRR